jgi:hypothetical protein
MKSQRTSELIEAIPSPQAIRQRLAHLMREQDILRSLLRVAERKEAELVLAQEAIRAD